MQQNNGNPDKKSGLSWSTPATTTKALVAATPSHAGRYVGMLAAGIIIGILLSWGYSAATNGSKPVTTEEGTKTATTVPTQNGNAVAAGVHIGEDGTVSGPAALEVVSPQKAGLSVGIKKVSVTKPTWVVVYESRNGQPGNVLGAHLFFSTGPGTVTLLRATVAGGEYFAGMSPDNGDRKYSKAVDKPTTRSDGSLDVARFTTN